MLNLGKLSFRKFSNIIKNPIIKPILEQSPNRKDIWSQNQKSKRVAFQGEFIHFNPIY